MKQHTKHDQREPQIPKHRDPRCRIHDAETARGFTYMALLVAIIIIGISLGSAARFWQNFSLREKEMELLFRGEQYRQAIERYYFGMPGRMQYPASLDELLKDSRSPSGKRYLRQKYKDPISGEEFVEVRDQLSKRIIGVHSPSDKEPLRKGNFPEQYKDFEGKDKYSDWVFSFVPKQGIPGAQPRPQIPVPPPGLPPEQHPKIN